MKEDASGIGGAEMSAWRIGGWYLAMSAPLHVVWEFAHMPLYAVWHTGTPLEIVYNGLHCAIGDLMIAASSLLLAVVLIGREQWPSDRWWAVVVTAGTLGVGYTIFSEWHNVFVLRSWAYGDLMPRLPGIGIGLSPLLQWLVIPPLAFWLTYRRVHIGVGKGPDR